MRSRSLPRGRGLAEPRFYEAVPGPETPRYLLLHKPTGAYYWHGPGAAGDWPWVNLGKDLDVALAAYRALLLRDRCRRRMVLQLKVAAQTAAAVRHATAPWTPQALASGGGLARQLYYRGRSGAAVRGLDWRLTLSEIVALLVAAGGHCAVSGIAFSDKAVGKRGARPWMPTLDRIDASLGYAPGNVRVVCLAANNALADFGDEVLLELAEAIVKRYGSPSLTAGHAAPGGVNAS